ncbi:MAG: acyltransferase [Gammaproteobacteria bacterium]
MKTTIEKWSLLALARFLLASIVVLGHIDGHGFAPIGWLWPIPHLGLFEAVLGFLLISGYSIGNSYRKQPEGFLKRRAWRVYPVYLGSLVLMCFAAAPQALDLQLAATLLQNVLFLNQITTDSSFVQPAWSLALEVWLYCLTPWLWRLKTEHLRILMFASFAAYCGFEVCRTLFHLSYYAGVGYGLNLPLLSFAWIGGFLVAREPAVARRTVRDCGLMFLGHVLLLVAVQGLYRWKHAQFADFLHADLLDYAARGLTLAAVTLLFKWIVDGRTGRTQNGAMRLLGDLSYPLYLVHLPLLVIMAGFGLRNAMLEYGAALAMAALFYWTIDVYGRKRERTAIHAPVTRPV